ncbi:hypothetical protein L6452_25951 [Arctium lappa]|uniref:Uncharacterized protein n=1 Tax=Arctium lappa TaxID=4217 RepID=A0ACB9ABR0_ARCLA|nr:hypothetical protein L6452_44743 [Arctium lappa]KAI3707436.1 hypothetical protein L6452_25951 [Arctium lappa]
MIQDRGTVPQEQSAYRRLRGFTFEEGSEAGPWMVSQATAIVGSSCSAGRADTMHDGSNAMHANPSGMGGGDRQSVFERLEPVEGNKKFTYGTVEILKRPESFVEKGL